MSVQTKTRIAWVLRQFNQGLITQSEAYHKITEIYYQELNHDL